MKLRLGFSARAWLLGTATGLILCPPAFVSAQSPVYVQQPGGGRTSQAAAGASSPSLSPPPRTPQPIQQTAGVPGQKSEVERELELLYRQAGKQPPSLDLSELPNTDPAYLQNVRKLSEAEQAQAKPGLLQRFFPFFRRSRPAPQTAQPAVPQHQPAPQQAFAPQPVQQPFAPQHPAAPQQAYVPQPPAFHAPVEAAPSPPSVTPGQSGGAAGSAPASVRALQGKLADGQTPDWAADFPDVQPVQDSKPQDLPVLGAPNVADGPAGDPLDDELGNAFPEVSEAQADGRSNPFSGLRLGDPAGQTADGGNSGAPFLPEPEDADLPAITPADVPLPAPNVADRQPETQPSEPQDHTAKMRLIAARSELKGLKGFCPVVLRDRRDLVDSRSQFSSTYKSKVYYFSSAEAKAQFDKEPSLYAPAEGGADVVMLNRDDVAVSGSLDYAAWFKNRLYLFSTRENLETFVQSPRDFASDEDFEFEFPDD